MHSWPPWNWADYRTAWNCRVNSMATASSGS